jgi:hypothetical protein
MPFVCPVPRPDGFISDCRSAIPNPQCDKIPRRWADVKGSQGPSPTVLHFSALSTREFLSAGVDLIRTGWRKGAHLGYLGAMRRVGRAHHRTGGGGRLAGLETLAPREGSRAQLCRTRPAQAGKTCRCEGGIRPDRIHAGRQGFARCAASAVFGWSLSPTEPWPRGRASERHADAAAGGRKHLAGALRGSAEFRRLLHDKPDSSSRCSSE